MPSAVSVVIPCYAQARFVADAVASVLAQTHPAAEIVVVNDGSPDTPAMERALAPFTTRIVYIAQRNRGLSAARNAGLERCTGAFVVFLDADDRLLPDALHLGAEALDARPACALVWGLRNIIDADGNVTRSHVGRLAPTADYAELLETNIVGPPVGAMFRRSALQAIGGFSSTVKVAEDYDVYLRLAQRHEIYCHEAMVGDYRLHGANMSLDTKAMFAGVRGVLSEQVKWVGGDERLRAALHRGMDDARERYDWEPRLNELSDRVQAGEWLRACASAAVLLARYPVRFVPVLARRARRAVAG